MVESRLLFEGAITITPEDKFIPRNIPPGGDQPTYRVKYDVSVGYLDWRGPMAGIYTQNPLKTKEWTSHGPNLTPENPTKEPTNAVYDVITSIVNRFHRLKTYEKREGDEEKELRTLSEFLEAA